KRQVGKDDGVLREITLTQRLLPLAGQHEDRLRADGFRCLKVAQRIPDAGDAGQLDAEALADFGQEPRLRLPAVATRVGGMRAEEYRVEAAADLVERLVELVVDGDHRRRVEQPAAEARLVGRHDHAKSRVVESRDRLQAAGDRAPLFWRLDELVAV